MAKPSKNATPASEPAPARRVSPKQKREQRRQRMVVVGAATALGVALLAIIAGILYDQVYVPSQTVASVNTTTLSRRVYWQERRQALARDIVQNMQLQKLLAGQEFGNQFAGRIPELNKEAAQIRSLPENQDTLAAWQARTVIEQGAQELNVSASDGEVNQRMVQDLGSAFLPPAGADQPSTGALTATAELSATVESVATTVATTVAAEPATTAAAEGADTAAATATPLPTITADEATARVDQLFSTIFDQYKGEIESGGEEANLERTDFETAMRSQYRQQVLTTRIEEHLVPEQGFKPETTPTQVKARHILCKIPDDTTEDQKEAAYAEAKARCDAIYAQLQRGADFAELAKEQSEDPGSKDTGGDLGFFGESSGFDPDFVKAAFALNNGEIGQPARTQFGYHVIQTLERRADPLEDQLREARSAAFDTWLAERRKAVTLVPAPTPTPEPSPTPEPTATPDPRTPTATTEPAPVEDTAPATTAEVPAEAPVEDTAPVATETAEATLTPSPAP